MGIFYILPAIFLWAAYGVGWWIGAPWWVDYPLFGIASVATALGVILVGLSDVGPRF